MSRESLRIFPDCRRRLCAEYGNELFPRGVKWTGKTFKKYDAHGIFTIFLSECRWLGSSIMQDGGLMESGRQCWISHIVASIATFMQDTQKYAKKQGASAIID